MLHQPLDLVLAERFAEQRDAALLDELVDFVLERLRAFLVGQTLDGRVVSVEVFESVRAMGVAKPLDFQRRVQAVSAFAGNAAAPNLAAANKRIRNILKQAGSVTGAVDAARFEHEAERALFAKLGEVEALNAKTADYTAQLVNLAALREPVDAFFDGVMVNAEDAAVRANRLALLARLDRACRSVADLSQLPG